MLFPELIGKQQWNELIENASILQRENRGIKVYLLPGQHVIKLFRVKRILSWSFVYPYSMRFARNSKRLRARGIPTVQVERVFYCHSIKRHGVIYSLMPGQSLHDLLSKQSPDPQLMKELADFMFRLHTKGVYFRSLHLGNFPFTLCITETANETSKIPESNFRKPSPDTIDQFMLYFQRSIHRFKTDINQTFLYERKFHTQYTFELV